jgi:hypothetical protein
MSSENCLFGDVAVVTVYGVKYERIMTFGAFWDLASFKLESLLAADGARHVRGLAWEPTAKSSLLLVLFVGQSWVCFYCIVSFSPSRVHTSR